ncbi:NAD(P)H-binding protein [Streptomyces decoyicus]|uniref:NAD(P)H-binding protein n=1 Tax=Streptomyces decoyicus TaxID=249567 RepID=UPI002E17CD39|nr:NAD(P)H-binding protein [Streptomyces decoyicus]
MSELLATGATGNVGRRVVQLLAARGTTMRALTRSPEVAELPEGVEVTGGYLSEPDTLEGR